MIVLPLFSLRFEPPKVLIAQLLVQFILVYVILTGKFSLKRVSKPLIYMLGGLFLLSLYHLLSSPTSQNWFGNVFRLQGTILFWHFLMLCLIAQNSYFRLKERYIYLCSLIGLCAGAFIYGSNSAGRLIGSLGEPNALGAVMVLVFPFVFLSFKSIFIRGFTLLMSLVVINFSQSKSALIAWGLQLVFLSLLKILKVSKKSYILASTVTIFLILVSLALPILEREYFLMTNTNPFNYRFEDRSEIWYVSGVAGLDSPVIGSGLESIQEKIKETSTKLNLNSQYLIIDSSHNLLLDYWVWGGAIGLLLILALILLAIINMVKKEMMLELTVFIGLLTVLSFNPTTVSVLAGFWWIIGRSFAKSEIE